MRPPGARGRGEEDRAGGVLPLRAPAVFARPEVKERGMAGTDPGQRDRTPTATEGTDMTNSHHAVIRCFRPGSPAGVATARRHRVAPCRRPTVLSKWTCREQTGADTVG